MRSFAIVAVMSLLPVSAPAGPKLTNDERIELVRGLTAEYATVKVLLPRSRKALDFESSGNYDKSAWAAVARESGRPRGRATWCR